MRLNEAAINVTLIATHQISFTMPVNLQVCVGVLALTASLRRRGIPCEVVDLSGFHHLYHRDFDEVMESVIHKILATHPDILGFSTMTNNLPVALELSERIKQRFPGIFIVFGGPGASFSANEIMEFFPPVDAVIRGEADTVFPDFVESLKTGTRKHGIKGAVYREDDTIIDNGWPDPVENLDTLPIPAYELFTNIEVEKNASSEFTVHVMEVGRGCPFTCVFCAASRFFKQKFRLKSVDRIIKEILYIREKAGNKTLMFLHDLLTLDHSFLEQLCREIKRRAPGLTWKCYARLDTLNESVLRKMRGAGCDEIFIGIEVASERMQRKIKKYNDMNGFDDIMEVMKELGFIVRMSFMVGFPFEKLSDTVPLFSFIMRKRVFFRDKVRIVLGTLIPEKVTPLYETWKHTLSSDQYGGFPGIDFPLSWRKPRQMVEEYPDIFFLYYHYRPTPVLRENSIKFTLLGLAVEKALKNALLLAYMALGDPLIAELVNNAHGIHSPGMEDLRNSDYYGGMDSIRRLVYEILERNDTAMARKFDAVAQYELAVMDLSRDEPRYTMRVIRAEDNPVELIDVLQTGAGIPAGTGEKGKELHFYLVVRDEEDGKIKFKEIPRAFAEMIQSEGR